MQKGKSKAPMHSAALELSFGSAKIAHGAHSALSCEGGEKERSSTALKLSGTRILINIRAKDLVALRASLNSILRLAQAINEVDLVKQE